MPPSCFRKGYEKGAWYEIKTVVDVIRRKQASGKDASSEMELLKAWSQVPGYESAAELLKTLSNELIVPEISKSGSVNSPGNRNTHLH